MIELVPAEMKHIPSVLKTEQASFNPAWTKDALINELGRSDVFFGLAVENCSVLGYCILRLVSGEAELYKIAVAGPCRRKGIGSLLLDGALAFCSQKDANTVYLEVRRSNKSAISLYEKHGFSCRGCRKKYYSNPCEDAVIMVLQLRAMNNTEGDL